MLVWELARPLPGRWEWQTRPCSSLYLHPSLPPCLLQSSSCGHSSAFPAREADGLFLFSFPFQIPALLVGSVKNRFISEDHILFCKTLKLPASLKESPKYLPMAWSPSQFVLSSSSLLEYFHQDDTATRFTITPLSFLGCSKVGSVADCLWLYHCMAAVLSDTETQRAPFSWPVLSSSCS